MGATPIFEGGIRTKVTNLDPLGARYLPIKFQLWGYSGFGEEVENVKSLRTDGRTDGRTTDDGRTPDNAPCHKPIWPYWPDELKIEPWALQLIRFYIV